jgi:hypothetical protein
MCTDGKRKGLPIKVLANSLSFKDMQAREVLGAPAYKV